MSAIPEEVLGLQFPGGCDDCNAYQVMERLQPGIVAMITYHDDTCPFYTKYRRQPGYTAMNDYITEEVRQRMTEREARRRRFGKK